jgi:hypothetical protein
MRLNVYVPDDLAATVREQLPGLNVSATLQAALADRLECRHSMAVCADCAQPLDLDELTDARLSRFYVDLFTHLETLVDHGGTAEGAARVAKTVAEGHRVSMAARLPLPRPTRARRAAIAAGEVSVFPEPADSVGHHPTNHRRTA